MIIKSKIQWIRVVVLISFAIVFVLGAFLARRWDFCLSVAMIGFLYAHASRGCQESALKLTTSEYEIGGFCRPEYESVLRIFQTHVQEGMHNGVQCAMYVKGAPVFDLWASRKARTSSSSPYMHKSIQQVFSSTKVISSLVLAMLADRGHIRSLDMYVKEIWPEFVSNGKDRIRISDVLRHDSGLREIRHHRFSLEELDSVHQGVMGKILQDAVPENIGIRNYHAWTRGWLLNEIVRRVDPKHRTIGEFCRDEICIPLNVDFYIGLSEQEMKRAVDLTLMNPLWALLQSCLPRCLGSRVPWSVFWFLRHGVEAVVKNLIFPGSTLPFVPPFSLFETFNHKSFRSVEVPSANGYTNASSMARIASCLANGGEIDGTRLISRRGLERALSGGVLKRDVSNLTSTKNTLAGWTCYDSDMTDNREGFVGWTGFGGSAIQFHPKENIGFGYAMNLVAVDLKNCAYAKNAFLHHEIQMAAFSIAKRLGSGANQSGEEAANYHGYY